MLVAEKFLREDHLKLNWRDLPSGSDILGRLQKLLATIDSTGELRMELAMSKTKSIISLVEISMNNEKAIICFSKLTVKRFNSKKVSIFPTLG